MRITGIRAAALLIGLLAAGAAQAENSLISQMIQSQGPWMRFAVVDGRVSFICTRMTQFTSNTNGGSSREMFSVLNQNGQLALSYERTEADETVKVSVAGDGDDVTITRSPQGKSSVKAVEFRQSPGKPITLTIGAGESKQTFSAQELWQLMIVHPKPCEEHLLPLLDLLRPDWKIAATAVEIEDKLIHGAGPEIVRQRAALGRARRPTRRR